MVIDCWERDSNGDLIPQKGELCLFSDSSIKALEEEINLRKEELKTCDIEKNINVLKKGISILEDILEKRRNKIEILFTPLLYYEIKSLKQGLSCTGAFVDDISSDICSRHCKKPVRTYKEWRDLKDPLEKEKIAAFIIDRSSPKHEDEDKIKEVFQMFRELV